MRICVFGAGAIGGNYATRLAAAGNEVSVVARGPHLEAIRAKGLTLLTGDKTIVAKVKASDTPADLGPQGVRGNAISPGPMRTLAGAVIGGARYVYRVSRDAAPLRRNVELTDVGGAALYYLSDLSAGVTGTVHFVDSGYHAIGLPHDGSAAPSAGGEQ